MKTRFLSILIPTYNRAPYLKKNIELLQSFILNNNLENEITIIISNNYSTDNTDKVLQDLITNSNSIDIQVFNQSENIGLEKNALFVLEKAKSRYVMYLGDDDYLDERYLVSVVEKLSISQDIYCVLPAFQIINTEGKLLQSKGRDLNVNSKQYEKGFKNCLLNSSRGHQISGITFYREGLLESYLEKRVSNLYPFIYFAAYCCLRGRTWHFTDYPVLVTTVEQKNKDWGYGNDGLISHVFDNYKKLGGISYLQRSRLEMEILRRQEWRYMKYLSQGWVKFIKTIWKIESSDKTSWITKILFPAYLPLRFVYKFLKKQFK